MDDLDAKILAELKRFAALTKDQQAAELRQSGDEHWRKAISGEWPEMADLNAQAARYCWDLAEELEAE